MANEHNWCKNRHCLRDAGTSIKCLIDARYRYIDCRPMVYKISASAKYEMEMRVPVQNGKMNYWYVYRYQYIAVTKCYRFTGTGRPNEHKCEVIKRTMPNWGARLLLNEFDNWYEIPVSVATDTSVRREIQNMIPVWCTGTGR